MIKFLKELWKDYSKTQQQMAEMGIVQIILPTNGVFTYIDQEQFETYQQRLKDKIDISDT